MRSGLYTRLLTAVLHTESSKIAVSDFCSPLKPFFRIKAKQKDDYRYVNLINFPQ